MTCYDIPKCPICRSTDSVCFSLEYQEEFVYVKAECSHCEIEDSEIWNERCLRSLEEVEQDVLKKFENHVVSMREQINKCITEINSAIWKLNHFSKAGLIAENAIFKFCKAFNRMKTDCLEDE